MKRDGDREERIEKGEVNEKGWGRGRKDRKGGSE